MSLISLEITIILLLILLNGVLAMSEIAIVTARKALLQHQAESGKSSAGVALELAKQPGRFLSTVQIGITLVGVLAGAFGGATLARNLGDWLARLPGLAKYSEAIGVGIVVILITYLTLILGELAPKHLALRNPEGIAAAIAPTMNWLSRLTSPLVSLLNGSTNLVLRLLRVKPVSETQVSEEEIKILIEQGTLGGVFEPIEEQMVGRVFRLGDRRVSSLMTPRTEVAWLDLEDRSEILQDTILHSDKTCFPVARGDLDQLAGIVKVQDLLAQCFAGQALDIQKITRPAMFVPENMPALAALEQFKQKQNQFAIVIDEYGGIQGVVTTTDILEAIIGDLPEARDAEDPDIIQRADGTWLLDGMLPVDRFKDLFDLKELPGEAENYYQTLAGFVLSYLSRIPSAGDFFEWQNLRFEIVDMDGNRVDKILVSPVDGDPK